MTDKNGLYILVSHLSICQRRKIKLISAGRAILPLAAHAGVAAFYDVICCAHALSGTTRCGSGEDLNFDLLRRDDVSCRSAMTIIMDTSVDSITPEKVSFIGRFLFFRPFSRFY